MADKILFEETQSNKYLIVAFLVISFIFGVLIVIQLGLHQQIGSKPAPNWLLFVFFIGGILGLFFFRAQKLKFLVTEDEIHIRFGLLTGETVIGMNNVKRISVRKYSAIKEFGGWGVRYNNSTSSFTVFGTDGVEIELVTNEIFLVGTQRAKNIQMVIDQFLSAKNRNRDTERQD